MRVDFRRAPALREGERRGQTAANEGGTAPAVQKQGLQSVPRILPKGTRFLFCKASGEAFAGIPPFRGGGGGRSPLSTAPLL